jgi:hypothetical protein
MPRKKKTGTFKRRVNHAAAPQVFYCCRSRFSAAAVGNHTAAFQGFVLPPPSNDEVLSPSRSRIGLEPLSKPPLRLIHCDDLLPSLYIYRTVGK